MEYLVQNWGSLASLAGLVVSLIGLTWAIWTARQARTAARAAEVASIETRAAFGRTLSLAGIQRAIAMVQSIQEALRQQQWNAALVLCPGLSAMLHDINVSVAIGREMDSSVLYYAVGQVSVIERLMSLRGEYGPDLQVVSECSSELISIRNSLEQLASSIIYSNGPEGE